MATCFPSFSGDGGPATRATVDARAVALDSAGNLYIGGSSRVRRVTPAGVISTHSSSFATAVGFGLQNYSTINGLAMDSKDNLYIADNTYGVFRMASGSQAAIRIAGYGNVEPGDGGPATSAVIYPWGVAADAAGNVYIADRRHRIRRVTPAGIVTTLTGSGVADFAGDGGPAARAQVNDPAGIVLDPSGNILFCDQKNERVRRISATTGVIETILGGPNRQIGDGGPASAAALFSPSGLALDLGEQLLIADSGHHRVRRIAADGTISTVAGVGVPSLSGDGGPAASAGLHWPKGIAVGPAGDLVIGDYGNRTIRQAPANGAIRSATVPGNGVDVLSFAVHPDGTMFGAQASPSLVRWRPEGAVSLFSVSYGERMVCNGQERFTSASVWALTVAPSGKLFGATAFAILELNHTTPRPPTGTIATRIAGGDPCNFSGCGFAGDGGAARDARFCFPEGIASDRHGNLYVADTSNHRIRKIFTDGTVLTIAGTGEEGSQGDGGPATSAALMSPRALVVDFEGIVYVTDGSNRVRVLTPVELSESTVRGENPIPHP